MLQTINNTRNSPLPDEDNEIIAVEHLYKSFGSNKVLIDFSMLLHKEENIVVLGKSGSGKSVLIKCIIGLVKPDSGTIRVLGQNIPNWIKSGYASVFFFRAMPCMIQ